MTAQMDLLDLLAHDPRKEDEYRQFLDACKAVRLGERQYVGINEVRRLLSNEYGLSIEPRRYSSFWRRARTEGLLEQTNIVDRSDDERGRNKGRMQPLYRWVGVP